MTPTSYRLSGQSCILVFGLLLMCTLMGCSKGTESEAENSTQQAAASISVRVHLSPALAKRVGPGDTVFIFARAPQGPRMPLAVARKRVQDLPATLTLDDSTAMSPELRLSQFPNVLVLARISKSGTPMAQPGDLEGSSEVVSVGDVKTVEITIDKILTGTASPVR